MRGMVVLLVLIALIVAQGAPSYTFAANSGGPRVVLSINSKTTQRQVHLVDHGSPAYPTVDVTCDGKRWTLPLTRSEFAKNRTTATYAVPEDRAERVPQQDRVPALHPGPD